MKRLKIILKQNQPFLAGAASVLDISGSLVKPRLTMEDLNRQAPRGSAADDWKKIGSDFERAISDLKKNINA